MFIKDPINKTCWGCYTAKCEKIQNHCTQSTRTAKKVSGFPVSCWDDTNQTLPGGEKLFPAKENVTSDIPLGTGKPLTFFYSVCKLEMPSFLTKNMHMCALCSTNEFISRIAGIAGCRSSGQGTSREGQHCTAIHTNHIDFTAVNFYQIKKI
jgi:hypothetical protein